MTGGDANGRVLGEIGMTWMVDSPKMVEALAKTWIDLA